MDLNLNLMNLNVEINVEQMLQAERWSDYEEEESVPRPPKNAAKTTAKPPKAKASGTRVVEETEDGYTGAAGEFLRR